MDQEYNEDDEQEQQSQAESGSNLNDGSINQEDDQNIHNQLNEISKDKRQIKRICLLRIKKEWKSERQIFFAYFVMSLIALIVFCGIIFAYMNIATYLIEYSAQKETETIIQNTLNNSVQVCSSLYKEVIFRYSVTIKIISKLFLSSLNLDSNLYDYPAYSTFPLKGNKKYVSIKQDIPVITDEDKELSQFYQGQPVSMNYISYFSFQNKNDFSQISPKGQLYLDGADNLNYFLKDMIFFKKSLTRIQEDLQVFYPAGSSKQLLRFEGKEINFRNRPWYKKSIENYQKTNKVHYVITGPYVDSASGLPCITISQVILTNQNTIIGVIGLDLFTTDIDQIINQPQLQLSGKLYIANLQDGVLLNDPIGIRKDDPYNVNIPSYSVNTTAITNFTNENWSLIKDQTYKNGTFFEILDVNNEKVIVHRMFISSSGNDPELVIFAAVPHDESYQEYKNIQDLLSTDFLRKLFIVILTAGSITLFSWFISYYFVRNIVSPLQQLADCTKEFTNQEKKNSSSQIKKKSFDDIKTSDSDIESLILSFKKLIKDLSGFKKGTRKDNQSSGDDYIEYPRCDRENIKQNKEIRFLLNQDDFENKIKYQTDLLKQFYNILQNKNKENDKIQEIDYYDSSQNDSQSGEYIYQKIDVSFINFIEIQLNNTEQSLINLINKGQQPTLSEYEIQLFESMQIFFEYLNHCRRNIILYDKFRSNIQQFNDDQDPVQEEDDDEEEYSNLPEECLCMYDRKASAKKIDELFIKFYKVNQITSQAFKREVEKKNTHFIDGILPKEIFD